MTASRCAVRRVDLERDAAPPARRDRSASRGKLGDLVGRQSIARPRDLLNNSAAWRRPRRGRLATGRRHGRRDK